MIASALPVAGPSTLPVTPMTGATKKIDDFDDDGRPGASPKR